MGKRATALTAADEYKLIEEDYHTGDGRLGRANPGVCLADRRSLAASPNTLQSGWRSPLPMPSVEELPLDHFKNLLRLALTQQAQSLVLLSGQGPALMLPTGAVNLPGQEPITAQYITNLVSQLLPTEAANLAAQQSAKGYLQVPNVGRIQILALLQPQPSLRLYLPPDGGALFTAEWPMLSAMQKAPIAVAAGQSHSAPAPAAASPFALAAVSSAAPLAVVAQAAEAAPAAKEVPAHAGFIPAALVGQPLASSEPAKAAPVLQAVAPAPAPSPKQTMMFPPAPALDDDVVVYQPQGHAPQAHQARQAHQAPHAEARAHTNSGVDNPGVIAFGPDLLGAVGVSDGTNPIDRILMDMIKRKASDVHMTCGEPLCMRIDGDIVRVGDRPLAPEQLEDFLLPMIPKRNQAEFIATNDTDFAYEIRGVGRFRVNLFRDKNGAGSVMRHIPSTILTAEQLQLPPVITKFCTLSKGLVLVTGPTGSGKSTTLAAMIDLINKERSDHILTVEDPIEFVHAQQRCLVNQREVHKHTGSFSRALKAALREDPDIVLIGEMRDLETVAIAIETAETGHLVFGTLHTNTAVSTIDRIIDQFPTDQQSQIRMMLAASLRGVVAQTLLKKKKGGRVAAHEILVTSDAVGAMIREGKNHMISNHMQSQKNDGNLLLNDSLLKLVKDQVVDVEEAMRKAVDRTSFSEVLKRVGILPGTPQRPPGGSGTAR